MAFWKEIPLGTPPILYVLCFLQTSIVGVGFGIRAQHRMRAVETKQETTRRHYGGLQTAVPDVPVAWLGSWRTRANQRHPAWSVAPSAISKA